MRYTLLCLLALLCSFNCSAFGQNASSVDAFAAATSSGPGQAEPALRDYLRAKAVSLKQEWQQEGSPNLPSIVALFDTNKQSWKVKASHTKARSVDYDTATKLVRSVLQDKPPSIKQSFLVVFIFNSYPITTPMPQPGMIAPRIDAQANPVKASTPQEKMKTPSVVALTDVDFGPYMAMLQRKIKSNWGFTEAPVKNVRSVVVFAVKENGAVTGIRLQLTSGNATYDKAALSAVAESSPFLPLPEGSSDPVDIQFTFDYQPGSAIGDPIFSIELAQPEVVSCDFPALTSKSGHFRRF